MCVPAARAGVGRSEDSIAALSLLNGRTTFEVRLNAITASCSCRVRSRANTRAAAIASAIGCPRMLLLASISSTTPNCRTEPPPDGTTARSETGFPFSRTCTRFGPSRISAGRLRTKARSGNGARASVILTERSPAPAAEATVAVTRTPSAKTSRRLMRSPAGSPGSRPSESSGRRGRPAASLRACRTCRGTWDVGPLARARPSRPARA